MFARFFLKAQSERQLHLSVGADADGRADRGGGSSERASGGGCKRLTGLHLAGFEHVNLDLGVWVLDEHKTESKTQEPRVVILTPVMVELTKRLMARYPEGPLFRTANRKTRTLTKNAMTGIDVCRMMKRCLKAADLPGRFSPHSFRVTSITDLLAQGIALEDVQYLAGHSDPRTTRL